MIDRTKSGLPKYCSYAPDRHGKKRIRFRKSGFSTYLTGIPWSEYFMKQYAAALEGEKLQKSDIGSGRTRPGSIDALCVLYFQSARFAELRPSSKVTFRGIIERFRTKHGHKLIADLKVKHLDAIMASMSDRPQAANNLLDRLKVMLDMAVKQGMIASNPARLADSYARKTSGFHTWTDKEIEQFEAFHISGSKARLALALLLYTAQRRSDVVQMGWQHIRGERIYIKQQKTGFELFIKMHPALLTEIRLLKERNMTFLLTDRGAPYTAAGFGNWFRDRCNEAGVPGRAHGLRKAAAARMANLGLSADAIKAVTGHANLKELSIYTKGADQKRLADLAIDELSKTEHEQNLSNLETRLDKPTSN